MVVYQEYGCKPYDMSLIPSQFVQVIILVTELAPSEEGYLIYDSALSLGRNTEIGLGGNEVEVRK